MIIGRKWRLYWWHVNLIFPFLSKCTFVMCCTEGFSWHSNWCCIWSRSSNCREICSWRRKSGDLWLAEVCRTRSGWPAGKRCCILSNRCLWNRVLHLFWDANESEMSNVWMMWSKVFRKMGRKWKQKWKTREFCAISGKIFSKQNSFSSYICITHGLQMNSLVNFRDGHSALLTRYIAGVVVEWPLTYEGHYYLLHLLFVHITCGKV